MDETNEGCSSFLEHSEREAAGQIAESPVENSAVSSVENREQLAAAAAILSASRQEIAKRVIGQD
jgi:hypothetical protein